jgi:uncharacterized phage protein gp47/JayE
MAVETPVCTIDRTGIHKPDFSDVLSYIQSKYRSIYGEDVYIDADSQDGEFLALLATVVNDANAMAVSVYNAFSPSTAQGVGLSRVCKINGIAKKVPSFSSVGVKVVGVAGTVIQDGIVADEAGFTWRLPETVEIPISGEITVTATCTVEGAITALPDTVTIIESVTPGWQTVTNPEAASPGLPVETDVELRARQSFSASLPAIGALQGLAAAVAASPGVGRYRIYQNNHPGADDRGIPGYSVAVVVEGGDVVGLANTIYLKKGNGVRTYGTLEVETTPDPAGITHKVNLSPRHQVNVTYYLQVRPLAGFNALIEKAIRDSLSEWTNSLGIGNPVLLADAYMAARLMGAPDSRTFSIVPNSLKVGRDGSPTGFSDIDIAYNEDAYCEEAFVDIRLVY